MAGRWDNALKFLIQEKPQDFVSWLMGKGQWETELIFVESGQEPHD